MKVFFAILVFLYTFDSIGQKSTVYFHLDKITIKEKVIKDSTNFKRYESKAIEQFRLNGYVGIEFLDSVQKNNGTHYNYDYSSKYKNITIRTKVGTKQKTKSSKNKDFISTLQAVDKEITHLENNGYPFARIEFTGQDGNDERLILDYKVDSGDFFIIDKIHIKSQQKFHEKTILNLISLQLGDKYNEEKISSIGDLLSASKLYSLSRSVEVLFRAGKAEVYIYLKKERSSTADGYIGFQQDQLTSKLVLNGFINLQLNNSLHRGEQVEMNWKSNPDKTQNLRSLLAYPFLFNTPLGMGAQLDLRKQDSTFLRTDITFNLSYYHPYFRFSLFDQLESSSTLRATAPSIYRNYRKNTLGASAQFSAPAINSIPFYHPDLFLLGGFYNYRDDTIDDNKQKVTNSKYQLRYSHTIDFFKYFHLNNSVQFQGLTSNISLSRNELIYFGGLRSVRGFYELELSGNDIWTFLNEIEFRPVDLISIFLLYDRSAYQNNGAHFTNSVGLGFALNSKSNSLEIIVANGVLDNNPLDMANTKIHIGFKSTF